MTKELFQEILDKYGDRATVSEFERSLYTRDLAPVPALLVKPLFNTLPDIVVRPANTEEVAEILRIAYQNKIPVTPRAGASTVYFDSVPTQNGILMDLNLLKGIVEVDETGLAVKVRAATTWSELDDYLFTRGLAAKSVPSSAPAATVGGWFCMMGYGIGSLKYGNLFSQVKSAEVVLPDGTVKRVTRETDPSLDWFVSSEGTLGILTELEVEVRRLTPLKHFLIQLPDDGLMLSVMEAIIKAPLRPYNMHFSDHYCLKALQVLGFSPANMETGCLVGVDYEGSEEELQQAEESITGLAAADKRMILLPRETAELEWRERYKAMKLKRGGPSVLGGEVWLPIKELTGYLEDVQKMSRGYELNLISYGHVVTPEYVTMMTTFYADESKTIRYIINLSLVKKIQDIGYRHGGYPYGVGLWNTPYLSRIYEVAKLGELRNRKHSLDGKGIMNPGKVYRSPLMLNPFNFSVGMNVLAGVRKVLGKGW
ncbi:MAG TPA: FAD-binding oxidoreductase [Syntrophomonadaceae bacterium]|nr:FAD-binding oxidoreductase [Syntrophomonadaceae bacterium]